MATVPRDVRTEKDEQAAIIEAARAMGAQVYVLGTKRPKGDYPGTRQSPGIPDLWIVFKTFAQGFPPCGLWWEVKRPGSKRRPEQVEFGDNCVRCRTPYRWGDLDAFLQWAKAHGRAR